LVRTYRQGVVCVCVYVCGLGGQFGGSSLSPQCNMTPLMLHSGYWSSSNHSQLQDIIWSLHYLFAQFQLLCCCTMTRLHDQCCNTCLAPCSLSLSFHKRCLFLRPFLLKVGMPCKGTSLIRILLLIRTPSLGRPEHEFHYHQSFYII
jgi:hypothetical protein